MSKIETNDKITFFQNAVPTLQSGSYELHISQAVGIEKAGVPSTKESFENAVYFAVQGERFHLNPDTLHSSYPPPNTEGDYGTSLPHVVFNQSTLPWARSPIGRSMLTAEDPENKLPWLAVLLFDESEEIGQAKNVTLGDLFKISLNPKSTLGDKISYFENAHSIKGALEEGEKIEDQCSVIDIPLTLFKQIVPTLEELKSLAHVRGVDLKKQEKPETSDWSENSKAEFSVVFGSRLPEPGKKSLVHLVSLENLGPYTHSPQESDSNKTIRLVSLAQWSFTTNQLTSTDENPIPDFVRLLSKLNVCPLRCPNPPATSDAVSDQEIRDSFEKGFIPLAHEMREGDQSISWYRGPLLPFAKNLQKLKLPIGSADSVTSYNPDTGLLDVSYSVAWQLGKLLALENKTYSTSLYQVRLKIRQEQLKKAESNLTKNVFSFMNSANAKSRDVNETFMFFLKAKFSENLKGKE